MESRIVFADEKVKAAYDSLKASAGEHWLLEALNRAFADLQRNAFFGIQIPKHLIPKEYQRRFGPLDNLWKVIVLQRNSTGWHKAETSCFNRDYFFGRL